MAPRRFRSSSAGIPSFVQPFLHSLNQMREHERLRPDQLTDRAKSVLVERFGPSSEPIEAAFAHAPLGLIAEHTHFFDGFAIMMSLPFGMAVAVRPAVGAGGIAMEAGGSRDEELTSAVSGVISRLSEGELDVAVVSNIPASLVQARAASAVVAATRSLAAQFALAIPTDRLLDIAGEVLDARDACHFSRAYLQAASVTEDVSFILVDTNTRERIALDVPPVDRPGFALIDTGPGGRQAKSKIDRADQSAKVLAALQAGAFPRISSLRDVEHRDLERAVNAVPRKLRPTLQYLVTENGRVQKLVAAIRRRDWQMFGALLLMSHASKRHDWQMDDAQADFVIEQAETGSLEGIYGGAQLGLGRGPVLVVGQPFSVPPFLEAVRPEFLDKYGEEPETILL